MCVDVGTDVTRDLWGRRHMSREDKAKNRSVKEKQFKLQDLKRKQMNGRV